MPNNASWLIFRAGSLLIRFPAWLPPISPIWKDMCAPQTQERGAPSPASAGDAHQHAEMLQLPWLLWGVPSSCECRRALERTEECGRICSKLRFGGQPCGCAGGAGGGLGLACLAGSVRLHVRSSAAALRGARDLFPPARVSAPAHGYPAPSSLPKGFSPREGAQGPHLTQAGVTHGWRGTGDGWGEMLFPLTSLPNRPGNGSRRAEEVPQEGWRWWCPTMG